MTSEALAKLYAEVVKVRPEAEVTRPGGGWKFGYESYSKFDLERQLQEIQERWHLTPADTACRGWRWLAGDPKGTSMRLMIHDQEAEGIILAHWISMLPEMHSLHRGIEWWWVGKLGENEEGWIVVDNTSGKTPIEALASYLKSTGTEVGG